MKRHRKAALLTALLLDVLLGDPPNRLHPVAWMGTTIAYLRRRAPRTGDGKRFAYGALISPGGALLVGALGWLIERACAHLPVPLNWLVTAVVLKTCLSLRGLNAAAHTVETALTAGDLSGAQRALRWHLVSRETAQLDAARVAAAAVESVAENTGDGVVAPLIGYALGGLPLALAHRFANTADSMLGYRDAEREWLGKAPARFDDALNLLPSRVTALLFIAAAGVCGEDAIGAWRIWQRDAGKTSSPNAGQPMSAMAGALGVELEKVDQYMLNPGAQLPTAHAIRQARRLLTAAVGLMMAILLLIPEKRR